MKETEWAKKVVEKINSELSKSDIGLKVQSGKKIIYAYEIKEYTEGSNIRNKMAFETDILISEIENDRWKPRVVIETKVNRITTHDAITYSQKSLMHKSVHPYLRYGIFLGNRKHYPLPGRLFRHGAHFDFMLSWKKFDPNEKEWEVLMEIIYSEIEASKKLEEMIFNSRMKNRKRYFALHKPLITK